MPSEKRERFMRRLQAETATWKNARACSQANMIHAKQDTWALDDVHQTMHLTRSATVLIVIVKSARGMCDPGKNMRQARATPAPAAAGGPTLKFIASTKLLLVLPSPPPPLPHHHSTLRSPGKFTLLLRTRLWASLASSRASHTHCRRDRAIAQTT